MVLHGLANTQPTQTTLRHRSLAPTLVLESPCAEQGPPICLIRSDPRHLPAQILSDPSAEPFIHRIVPFPFGLQ